MGCAAGMVKYLVFLFNLIFAIAGLAMLVVGILCQVTLNDSTKALENSAFALAPTLVIIVGAIVFIISFFGCCGAVKESTCMLTTYAVILLGLFILQIAIGVFAFLQVKEDGGNFRNEISKSLSKAYSNYLGHGGKPSTKEGIDIMQQAIKCCGPTGPTSWSWGDLPSSCCENNNSQCFVASPDVFHQGCNDKLYKTLKDNVEVLGYVALGLCATELIAAIFSLCLTSSIRNERRRGHYA